MSQPTPEKVLEQIRRDAAKAAMDCPEPTIEQMRQVGDVLRPAIARLRDGKRKEEPAPS